MRKIEVALQRHGGDKKKAIDEIRKVSGEGKVIESIDTYLSIVGSIKELAAS